MKVSTASKTHVASEDLGVMKMTLEYGDNRVYASEIVELQDGKIKRARAYVGEPFEATGVAGAVDRKDGVVGSYSSERAQQALEIRTGEVDAPRSVESPLTAKL